MAFYNNMKLQNILKMSILPLSFLGYNSCEQENFIGQLYGVVIYFKLACLLYFVTALTVRKGNDYGSIISETI